MKSLNLYLLAMETALDTDTFNKSEACLSWRGKKSNIKEHEKLGMKSLVENIYNLYPHTDIFDGFYFSYTIPQISKEFDLLKITKKGILNIELKSSPVRFNNMLKQLKQNKYYCHHLSDNIVNVTYIAKTSQLVMLENDRLVKISVNKLLSIMKKFSTYPIVDKPIESMFKPDMFLISPLSNPRSFLSEEYFLTDHQFKIRNKIVDLATRKNGNKYFSIEGNAGTGKTLLIYDIAKTLSDFGKVLIIHCGKLCDGHNYINDASPLTIISDDDAIQGFSLKYYDFILVDESHKICDNLFLAFKNSPCKFIFALDEKQVLSKNETERNIYYKIKNLSGIFSFRLTDTIRVNKEISSFIVNMFNLSKRNVKMSYKDIDLLYTDKKEEFIKALLYYTNLGYVFINYSDTYRVDNNFTIPEITGLLASDVSGQEFDKVVMFVDNNFFYDENVLKSKNINISDYILTRLLYQGATRVRKKLTIITYNNKKLYKKLINISYKN